MINIPESGAQIDADWLSEAVGARVSTFEMEFLEGGVLSDAFRLHDIRYASDPSTGPISVIVKIASRYERRREMAIENNAYLKELNFFRDLASDVSLRTPAIYHANSDGSEGAERFVLVMEDLRVHSRVFDQVDDNPDEPFMRKIAVEIAAMHAKYWESPEIRLPWLSPGSHRYVFTFDAACRQSPDRLLEFIGLWRKMYGRELFEEGGARESEAITRLLCGPESEIILDRISDRLSQRPHTLLHGDLRADNIFRSDPSLGLGVDDSALTYIDWQLLGVGPPGIDFAQAWIHSLPTAVRRKDTDVLRLYHERLVSLNPTANAYSLDVLIEDYVLGLCLWWPALVTIGANTLPSFDDSESERMKRLWEVAIPRGLIALADHNSLSIIEAIAAG
ncbi:MAG: phosphotransferase [Deltaproteobacteria bacterium]|nr:phosphotransferase [Deltaproteobacteria bacterium]